MLKHSVGNHFIFPDLLDRFLISRTHGVFLYFYGKINKTVDIICDHIFSIRAVGIPVNFSLKTKKNLKMEEKYSVILFSLWIIYTCCISFQQALAPRQSIILAKNYDNLDTFHFNKKFITIKCH